MNRALIKSVAILGVFLLSIFLSVSAESSHPYQDSDYPSNSTYPYNYGIGYGQQYNHPAPDNTRHHNNTYPSSNEMDYYTYTYVLPNNMSYFTGMHSPVDDVTYYADIASAFNGNNYHNETEERISAYKEKSQTTKDRLLVYQDDLESFTQPANEKFQFSDTVAALW